MIISGKVKYKNAVWCLPNPYLYIMSFKLSDNE